MEKTLRYRGKRITYFGSASLHPWDSNLLHVFQRQENFSFTSQAASLWAPEEKLDDSSVVKSWFQRVRSISWHQPQTQHCFALVKTLPKTYLWLSVKFSGHLPTSVWKGSSRSSGRKLTLWMNSKFCWLLHLQCLREKEKAWWGIHVGHWGRLNWSSVPVVASAKSLCYFKSSVVPG